MKDIQVGLIGFGNIGAGVVRLLKNNADISRAKVGAGIVLKRIADLDITTDRARALRADASLAPEARQAQLAALAQEATQKLTTILGEKVFADFRKGAGRWVDQLQPKP